MTFGSFQTGQMRTLGSSLLNQRVGEAVFFTGPEICTLSEMQVGRAVVISVTLSHTPLPRRAPLQVSALRLRRHPIWLAQVSPAAPSPGAEEWGRPWATPRAATPFPAGFGSDARSQGSSAACDLDGGCHEPPAFQWCWAGVPSKARQSWEDPAQWARR